MMTNFGDLTKARLRINNSHFFSNSDLKLVTDGLLLQRQKGNASQLELILCLACLDLKIKLNLSNKKISNKTIEH